MVPYFLHIFTLNFRDVMSVYFNHFETAVNMTPFIYKIVQSVLDKFQPSIKVSCHSYFLKDVPVATSLVIGDTCKWHITQIVRTYTSVLTKTISKIFALNFYSHKNLTYYNKGAIFVKVTSRASAGSRISLSGKF